MRANARTAYAGLGAHLPPPERARLVFIDPPYEEQSDDLVRAIAGIDAACSAWRTQ